MASIVIFVLRRIVDTATQRPLVGRNYTLLGSLLNYKYILFYFEPYSSILYSCVDHIIASGLEGPKAVKSVPKTRNLSPHNLRDWFSVLELAVVSGASCFGSALTDSNPEALKFNSQHLKFRPEPPRQLLNFQGSVGVPYSVLGSLMRL